MGSCIICGTSVDGYTCSSHEEDVLFEFTGNRPGQLSPGRYYRGTVDGYADFGVFVDVGDSVTGLLHKSELDTRLESLDWEPGDAVFVQVTGIRDNGNVDLGWSIRQEERSFRGVLIDDPEGDRKPDEDDADADADATADDGSVAQAGNANGESGGPSASDGGTETSGGDATVATNGAGGGGGAAADEAAGSGPTPDESPATPDGRSDEAADAEADPGDDLERVTVESLGDRVGETVRIEGRVVSIRQTSGPTVFELRDETAAVKCAAFVEAGVRAYPDVEVDDAVRLEGEVEERRGELQVETEALARLDGEDETGVFDRLEAAIDAEARPDDVELLADHEAVAAVEDRLVEAATAIRRAVMEERPVLIRHTATADGYVAGAAIERAILPLVASEHAREDAKYHYVERKPLDDPVYDMDAATDDATEMLDAKERHDEQLPLVVLVDAGSTRESVDGYRLLDLYGAERVVVDANHPDEDVAEDVSTVVNPGLTEADADDATTTALAATLATLVEESVREAVAHLPAVSYWEDAPEAYVDLAADAGVDAATARTLREAVAMEAYYQSYSDKRQLVADVLFAPDRDLAGHVSEQFRVKLDDELETARENLSTDEARGIEFAVLDTDAYTHRFDFPPTGLLLDALHREGREDTDATLVTIGLGEDELHLRATEHVDVRAVGEAVRERVPDAGVRVVGGRDGSLEFLSGERAAVLDAAVAAVAEELTGE